MVIACVAVSMIVTPWKHLFRPVRRLLKKHQPLAFCKAQQLHTYVFWIKRDKYFTIKSCWRDISACIYDKTFSPKHVGQSQWSLSCFRFASWTLLQIMSKHQLSPSLISWFFSVASFRPTMNHSILCFDDNILFLPSIHSWVSIEYSWWRALGAGAEQSEHAFGAEQSGTLLKLFGASGSSIQSQNLELSCWSSVFCSSLVNKNFSVILRLEEI